MRNKKDDATNSADRAGRRNFLKGAVVAPVAGEAQATESRQDARKARYRETEHVRRFYATNRY
jgi:hypothetical protein